VAIRTGLGFEEGLDAFVFSFLLAFGLRVSLFDFICDLAMENSLHGRMPKAGLS
jgi:hypothetical protein